MIIKLKQRLISVLCLLEAYSGSCMCLTRRLFSKEGRINIRDFFNQMQRGSYQSETSKCRLRLARFCTGYGVDLGFGGDPITSQAIRVDSPMPYANTGTASVQLGGDATRLHWFRDGVLDYVYSSHLLEDFEDTKAVLREWVRVLKPGGNLVLFCPDEQVYRQHCKATGQVYNENHKHPDFSLEKAKALLSEIGGVKFIHETPLVDIYSWDLVAQKIV
ncbi:MAG: methyltransferase domain-containing protein [Methylacidiphilales bacterium]|nr:methyltransferase domain-containing protein [Candidatus Methylacidiphilales bacterium]